MSNKPQVGIVMGSKTDFPVMEEAANVLDYFGIQYEVKIASAHRSPQMTREYAVSAKKAGLMVIIAGAGGAAHLAGVIASETTLPVIGVPVDSTSLGGLDSLLSTVQMPGGVPVASMAVGKSGARNAGVLAAQIIGLSDSQIDEKLEEYKKDLAKKVEKSQIQKIM